MNFTQALEELRKGRAVRRPSWKKGTKVRYPGGRNKYLEISGNGGSPGRWTPWIEDFTASDWEVQSGTKVGLLEDFLRGLREKAGHLYASGGEPQPWVVLPTKYMERLMKPGGDIYELLKETGVGAVTGGDCTIHTGANPPVESTAEYQLAEWAKDTILRGALGSTLIQRECQKILDLYKDCLDTGSTIEKCSCVEGMWRTLLRLDEALNLAEAEHWKYKGKR